jgi:hypothetical protein
MHHDCGETALERSCCAGETQNVPTLVAMKSATAPIAPAVVVTVLHTLAPFAPFLNDLRHTDDALKPPGVATYVLVSSFRI